MAAPELDVSFDPVPSTGIAAGGKLKYETNVSNVGTEPTEGEPIVVDFEVPEGVEIVKAKDTTAVLFEEFGLGTIRLWECTVAEDRRSAGCEGIEPSGELGGPFPIFPGEVACAGVLGEKCPIDLILEGDPGLAHQGTVGPVTVEVSGGGAAEPATASDSLTTWLAFDLIGFESATIDDEENPYTQAGGRPHEDVTTFSFPASIEDLYEGLEGLTVPNQEVHDTDVLIPPGLVANPSSYPQCTEAQLATASCSSDSQVGTLEIKTGDGSSATLPLQNMVPARGEPARFGVTDGTVAIHLRARIRPENRYGLTVETRGITQALSVTEVALRIWGVPADPAHDDQRRGPGCKTGEEHGCASTAPLKPYLTMPTSCTGPHTTIMRADSWQNVGTFAEDGWVAPGNDGCNALDFSPTIQARPTTNVADAPSGLDIDVHTPQQETCDPGPPLSCEAAEAHLKDTEITLPEGFVINPSGANGLGACTPAQVGIDPDTGTPNSEPPSCPNSSRIGSVEVDTPLIEHPLPGSVYLATPYDNPSDSLIAIYIVVDDPESGTLLKLDGHVTLDPRTGRLTTSVAQAPQLPFEHFRVHIFGGAQGALRTPGVCGSYITTSILTPWSAPDSGPPAKRSDVWAISRSPDGGACPASEADESGPPGFNAGTISPIAGAFSPFAFILRRDGTGSRFGAVSLALPPGLVAKVSGIPFCPDSALAEISPSAGTAGAQFQQPSCPRSSRVGRIWTAAGAGPQPYHLDTGAVYLAGPYGGAPLSLAVVSPALVGPFDLGTVVVRMAVHLDPDTAQLRVLGDPLPSILSGIPLDLRTLHLTLDRPGFIRNPTSCEATSITGTATPPSGLTATLSDHFQLGECAGLRFRPRLSLRLDGAVGRNGHPRLTALVRPREGEADLRRASVLLPRGTYLDPGHIRQVCTGEEFAKGDCPPGSAHGWLRAWSPLLDRPLTGRIYLRESPRRLPDLAADLHGQVQLRLAARLTTHSTRVRANFHSLPEVPFSRLKLVFKGGRRGLLVNSESLCHGRWRAAVSLLGHNGGRRRARPMVRVGCGRERLPRRRSGPAPEGQTGDANPG
jgi:hypothetical protein